MTDKSEILDDAAQSAGDGEGADGYAIYVVGDRSLAVIHPAGHRWNLQFPEGWSGGTVREFAPIRWAKETPPPDEASLREDAMAVAVDEAKRQGWL